MKISHLKKHLRIVLLLAAGLVLGGAAVSCDAAPPPGSGAGSFGMCGAGLIECAGACKNPENDPANCGGCGVACQAGQRCVDNTCSCVAPLQLCAGSCSNVQSDPANCGACGNVCAANLFCSQGTCSDSCAAGLTPCGQSCVDTNSELVHCGGCNQACGVGQECQLGSCACVGNGQRVCAGSCIDVLSDSNNCGQCNMACGAGVACLNGQCDPAGAGVGGATAAGGTAGATAAGGSAAGGASGGMGGTGQGGDPPGYWRSESWFGCSWTGIDVLPGSTTVNQPQDFLTHTMGEPYSVAGTVHADYDAVALLGFNLAEPPEGADCSYKPVDPNAPLLPAVTLGGSGLHVAFGKKTGATLRIQVQGPTGAFNEDDRWCYTIEDVNGPIFAPYSEFNSKCWDGTGTTFNPATNTISAISFLVPGAPAPTPFDYCIFGFAQGEPSDPPPAQGECGPIAGTLGGGPDPDLDFQRVKVSAGGHSYIIQNNNWGTPSDDQVLSYVDNSFTITDPPGGSPGGGAPASFPSIFIGGNGDTQGGLYSTRSDDGLPRQLSQITSVTSTFRANRISGDYNVAYDIWVYANPPAGEYNEDTIAGYVMLWLYDPGVAQPIGSAEGATVNIEGRDWQVWVGPRGGSGPNANAPVVSFVAQPAVSELVGIDLKPFLAAAGSRGINQSWYLTDVFAGFEIWNGGSANGLAVTEFTAVVQ